MPERLQGQFPTQGWKQILTARQEMLDAFDRAKAKAGSHEIETYHGKVAEAEFRKWLSGFLPKKYGVTSGYIVSSGLKSTVKTPHFDVIIYDQLESPVLWVEDDPDVSSQGRALAIPVEFVRAVIEVKSRLAPSTVDDAINHLHDLLPLTRGPDLPDERYKLHLPPTFCCGIVFFDLKSEYEFSEASLSKMLAGLELRGFFGGLVLRGETHSKPLTGRISLLRSETPMESTIGKGKTSLLKFAMCQSVQVTEKVHLGCMVMWLEAGFAQFAFDLIALMDGRFKSGFLSSFYGMGTSEAEAGEW